MTDLQSTPAEALGNSAAVNYLSGYLNKTLRIHTTDRRMFAGQLKCTDKDRNTILAFTHEYRQPSQEAIRKAAEETGNPRPPMNLMSRYVGLVVVPGKYITKISVEEANWGKPGA